MGYRLSKIVTRTGDDGSTGLGDGSRVGKESLRVAALGDVDELNSLLGVLLAESLPDDVADWLLTVQHDLFDLGGELAVPGYHAMAAPHVEALERQLERFNADLPSLTEFILPGGSRSSALAQQGRAVCRRAERAVVALARVEAVSMPARQYLNRLSDALFVVARHLNRVAGVADVLWQPGRRAASRD